MSLSLIDEKRIELQQIEAEHLLKKEREITSPQSSEIQTIGTDRQLTSCINFCANNYLGLANNQDIINAAKEALDTHGFGMASVRFICGTQDLHQELEARTAAFLKTEDCIVFASCFDANGGVFEPLLGADDAIISDALNHASIIDGIRLCKAKRYRYANNNMAELEAQLVQAQNQRHRLIVTDGVFSMDGYFANLPKICALAEKYDALVMVDDCHATGFIGERGAGTPEYHRVEGRIHLLSGTYGKALGGASGGYIAGPSALINILRQKARPYLFSNALAPSICAASIKAIELVENSKEARKKLEENAKYFRLNMKAAGFKLLDGNHPIIPIMFGEAEIAEKMAKTLLELGIYVVAFSYPVVPKGQARIRAQMSSIHTFKQIDEAVAAFIKAGLKHGVIPK